MKSSNQLIIKLETVIQTLWVGGLIAIGYLAVPILFNSLDDRQLAGMLAGNMFSALNMAGLACGAILLVAAFFSKQKIWFKERRIIVLLLMVVLVAVSFFILQPMMQELKAEGLVKGSDTAKAFGQLHGVSSVLYLINSLLGIYLVTMRRNLP